MNDYKLLVNGLSAGTGGGVTVARELSEHMGRINAGGEVTLALIQSHPMQEEIRSVNLGENVNIYWAPAATKDLRKRRRFEKIALADLARNGKYDFIINLNGMAIKRFPIPTLAHFQDPFPYRSEAWSTVRDRLLAVVKRRAHKHALRNAAICGWTSRYLEETICQWHGVRPKCSHVFYNGVPPEWLARNDANTRPLVDREQILATIGNVFPYKRQELVIRAVANLAKEPAFHGLRYRILGAVKSDYRNVLMALAEKLGVAGSVTVEGRVSEDQIKEAYESARVMPLMSICESFGIPVIEAMSFGTPVIVANSCALPEVANDAALICEPDDLVGLTDAIRKLLSRPSEAERIRRLGFERASRFSWRKTAQEMVHAIERYLYPQNPPNV